MVWSSAEEQRYIAKLRSRTEILREKTMQNINVAQTNQKRNYDKRYRANKAKDLTVGDFVLVKYNRARGLDSKYFWSVSNIAEIG